jgi:hypothetical protein
LSIRALFITHTVRGQLFFYLQWQNMIPRQFFLYNSNIDHMHVAQPDASTHSAGSVGHGIPTFPSHPSNSQNYFVT